jgi:hypothetical protein
MKKIILLGISFAICSSFLFAQKSAQQYPTPEFSNEIYFLKKDVAQVSRLEKGYSKVEAKTKMGGMGGGENGYSLEGSKSPVRLEAGNLSFIFFSGDPTTDNNPQSDSAMRANGMDPSMMGDAMSMMNDPSQTTSLYNMNVDKGSRKVTLQSYQGMKLLGKSKKESTKYTLSIKKVRKGYYELIVDKPLTKGEYAFVVMGMGMGMDGSTMLFSFGVD